MTFVKNLWSESMYFPLILILQEGIMAEQNVIHFYMHTQIPMFPYVWE